MEHTDDAAIRIENLSAGYPGRPVLHGVSATIPRGTATAITGPNGSGRSTLLHVLAGTLAPRAGRVHSTVPGRPALVLQHTEIPATLPLTVGETVAMGRWAHRGAWKRLTRADRAVVDDCLGRLRLGDLRTRRLDTLSGGQRQRTLLAQALAQRADLVLLDEPAAGLDTAAQDDIAAVVAELTGGGVTVVQVTHDRAQARRAGHCLVLRGGRLIAQGRPERVGED